MPDRTTTIPTTMVELYAARTRELYTAHPDVYAEWFSAVDCLGLSDRTVVRDALITIAERPDVGIVATGDQLEWLLWEAPYWREEATA